MHFETSASYLKKKNPRLLFGAYTSKWVPMIKICSTVIERATHMQMYAGFSPTSADHNKKLILA